MGKETAQSQMFGELSGKTSSTQPSTSVQTGGTEASAGKATPITEQAVRELYDLTATLQDRIQAIEAKRGPGRPPKEAE